MASTSTSTGLNPLELAACELFGLLSACYAIGEVTDSMYGIACDIVEEAGLDGLVDEEAAHV